MRGRSKAWVSVALAILTACGARSELESSLLDTSAQSAGGATSDGALAPGSGPLASAGTSAGAPGVGTPSAGGASAGAPSVPAGEGPCVPFTGTMLDNSEDRQPTKSIAPGLTLTWAPFFAGGPSIQFGAVQLAPPRGSSRVAMHDSANGAALGLGFTLSPCADVSSARGISFWARAEQPMKASANLYTLAAMPTLLGGKCDATACGYPNLLIELTRTWQQFTLIFDSLPAASDYSGFTALQIAAGSASGPSGLWVDDVELVY